MTTGPSPGKALCQLGGLMLGRFLGGLVSDSRGGGAGNPARGVEGSEHLDGGLRLPGYLRRGRRRGAQREQEL